VLLLLWPPWPADAEPLPVTLPVQPASGQMRLEPVWAEPAEPGTGLPSLLCLSGWVRWPESRTVVTVASLVTAQPPVVAEQVASVCESPGMPLVVPVVVAVQPGPVHWAIAVDSDQVAGTASEGSGFFAASVAAVAVFRASSAVVLASAAAFFCSAVAPGSAATCLAWSAACRAWVAWSVACLALDWFCSVRMSATTWPDAEVELETAWQALPVVSQVLVVSPVASGGPRAPEPPFRPDGPSIPVATPCGVPWHGPLPSQVSVAEAEDQLEAPGTVGPPELADEPGAGGRLVGGLATLAGGVLAAGGCGGAALAALAALGAARAAGAGSRCQRWASR